MALTASMEILKDMAGGSGPRRAWLALGHSGWAPGQLDREMQDNAWLVVDGDAELVFDPDFDAKWQRALDRLGGKHGIGRLDLVENRYVGMKSRGCYETPGGTIMLKAHRAIESITLDREVAHLKDDLMPRYASMIYNGYWWSPERVALQTLIDHTQTVVNGWVRVKLYKGNVIVTGRDSKTNSLFDSTIATFEDDKGAYDQKDAAGFIKLNALRLRIAANLKKKQ